MDLEKLNKKLEENNLYKFMQKHKKVLNILNGIFIIGLLIGINLYMVKDYNIKKQIADHCGYTTSQYKCICEKNYVENWEDLERGVIPDEIKKINVPNEILNNWSSNNVSVVR